MPSGGSVEIVRTLNVLLVSAHEHQSGERHVALVGQQSCLTGSYRWPTHAAARTAAHTRHRLRCSGPLSVMQPDRPLSGTNTKEGASDFSKTPSDLRSG